MKYLFYIITIVVVTFISCENNSTSSVKLSAPSKRNTKRNYKFFSDSLSEKKEYRDSLCVLFESGFIDDKVEVYFRNNKIFDEILATDNTIGIAAFLKVNKDELPLFVLINHDTVFKVVNLKKYNYLKINKKGYHITGLLTNRISYYK